MGNERVFAIDPENGESRCLWTGGAELDAVTSPDAARLYVTYIADQRYELAVIETNTGTVLSKLETSQLIRWIFPSTPGMGISSDGRWLYLLKANYELGSSAYSLLTFDTLKLQFTPEEQFIPDCPRPHILVIPGERKVKVSCDSGADIELPDASLVLRLPRIQNFAVGPGGNALYVAGWDGQIQQVNIPTHEIIGGRLLRSRRIMPSSGTLSSDGRLWYLPVKIPNSSGEQEIEQILVFDAQAMKMANVITPATPFWGLALSSDDKWLYASQPERESISVIDIATGRISRMLAVVGKPSIVFAVKRP